MHGSRRLESITIPDSVTFIDECAFNRCSGLRGITLSSGLTAIPDGFLTNSWLLGSLTIPASVTSIAPDAFDKSPNVTLIVPRDSYARQFAIEHGIAYTYEDADSWLN
ncbi:MAG: leucine-rich repeat domain-containing protein [Eubacteriales bacterium]|nr:leucine-rich repeat domain-containing protein [Eubacteriales bacterium]